MKNRLFPFTEYLYPTKHTFIEFNLLFQLLSSPKQLIYVLVPMFNLTILNESIIWWLLNDSIVMSRHSGRNTIRGQHVKFRILKCHTCVVSSWVGNKSFNFFSMRCLYSKSWVDDHAFEEFIFAFSPLMRTLR